MKIRTLGWLFVLCMAASLFAADAKKPDKGTADDTADAPGVTDFGNTWAQNGPYALASLKGKVAILYFYESG